MSSVFPTDFKELVRSRTNLVELVGQTVALTPTRNGTDYVGLCPFHSDNSPSFHVYPERQSWRCWVCDDGGDCFSFLQKVEALSFPASIERLANDAGIDIPQEFSRSRKKSSNREQIYEAIAWAEEQFHWFLMNSRDATVARQYLTDRGFGEETINKFKLGYHPNDWSWLIDRARDHHSIKSLLEARLIGERKNGNGYYDYFVDRVMFPIRDQRGRPVAFGGRMLPGSNNDPKYWNSPDSELFSKNRLLYAFDIAKEAIRQSKTAVVTEGYTDCISCHLSEISNTIATLGTALTDNHVSLLKRFADKVVLVFDGDKAGQNAAERSLAKFIAQEVDLRILTLPEGQDPADYLAEFGADSFNQLTQSAPEALDYKLGSLFNRFDIDSIDGRQRVLDEMLGLMATAPGLTGSIREDLVIGKLSSQLGVNERSVRNRYQEVRTQNKKRQVNRVRIQNQQQTWKEQNSANKPNDSFVEQYEQNAHRYAVEAEQDDGQPAIRFDGPADVTTTAPVEITPRMRWEEQEVLEIIFSVPDTINAISQRIGRDDFYDPQLGRLLELCFDLAEQGVSPSISSVTAAIEDPDLKSLALKIDAKRIEKEIETKISESHRASVGEVLSTEGSVLPAFIAKTLDNLKQRRAKQKLEVSKQKIARNATPGTLDRDTLESLRKAQEFHRQRAT